MAEERNQSKLVCRYFIHGLTCYLRSSCPFLHEDLSDGIPDSICRFYINGNCRYAEKECRFSHTVPPDIAQKLEKREKKRKKSAIPKRTYTTSDSTAQDQPSTSQEAASGITLKSENTSQGKKIAFESNSRPIFLDSFVKDSDKRVAINVKGESSAALLLDKNSGKSQVEKNIENVASLSHGEKDSLPAKDPSSAKCPWPTKHPFPSKDPWHTKNLNPTKVSQPTKDEFPLNNPCPATDLGPKQDQLSEQDLWLIQRSLPLKESPTFLGDLLFENNTVPRNIPPIGTHPVTEEKVYRRCYSPSQNSSSEQLSPIEIGGFFVEKIPGLSDVSIEQGTTADWRNDQPKVSNSFDSEKTIPLHQYYFKLNEYFSNYWRERGVNMNSKFIQIDGVWHWSISFTPLNFPSNLNLNVNVSIENSNNSQPLFPLDQNLNNPANVSLSYPNARVNASFSERPQQATNMPPLQGNPQNNFNPQDLPSGPFLSYANHFLNQVIALNCLPNDSLYSNHMPTARAEYWSGTQNAPAQASRDMTKFQNKECQTDVTLASYPYEWGPGFVLPDEVQANYFFPGMHLH